MYNGHMGGPLATYGELLDCAREFAVCVDNIYGYIYSRPCAKKQFFNLLLHGGAI